MPLTAAVLAGGLGTRLQPVLPDTAKTVAQVAGRPFIDYLLKQLTRAGASRIVLCTGFKSEQVRSQIGDAFESVPVVYSIEPQPLGTGGALRLAWQNCGDNQAWLVTNGDSYLDFDMAGLISAHRDSGCALTLAILSVPSSGRYGSVEWSAHTRRVLSFHEKTHEKTGEPVPGWINGGVYVCGPEFLNALSANIPLSLEKDVFPLWVERGINVYPVEGRFIDIGTPESYQIAQFFFGQQ
ncbi:MAG TPA: nucleotidyltransferase family protein [Bryobacteraceae bacterium]|nr:nucleotidyltransferase family protein [Bryobacteraceae bacterium]